jgi:hypothetical protein
VNSNGRLNGRRCSITGELVLYRDRSGPNEDWEAADKPAQLASVGQGTCLAADGSVAPLYCQSFIWRGYQ